MEEGKSFNLKDYNTKLKENLLKKVNEFYPSDENYNEKLVEELIKEFSNRTNIILGSSGTEKSRIKGLDENGKLILEE